MKKVIKIILLLMCLAGIVGIGISVANSFEKDDATQGHVHKYEDVVVEATCTTDGYSVKECSCGKSIGEKTVIKATGHSYADEITPATCTEQGYTLHNCEACGYSYISDYVTATGHRYGEWYSVTAPTCTSSVERRDCENCSYFETRDGELAAHTYNEWYITTTPTCTAEGVARRDCTECNHFETREVVATGHNYVITEEYEATCTEAGYKIYTCSKCVKSYAVSDNDALGHNFKNGICTVCGAKDATYFTFSLNKDAESYTLYDVGGCTDTEIVIPATYCNLPVTVIGDSAFKDCSDITSIVVPDTVTLIETCAFYNCTSLESVTIPDSVTSIKLYAFYNCSSLKTVRIPEYCTRIEECTFQNCTSLEAVTMSVYITEIEDYAFYNCTSLTDVYYTGCNDDWYSIIHEVGNDSLFGATTHYLSHSYLSIVTAPTCTEQGFTTHTCSECGNSYVDSYLKATGHTESDWIIDKAATCTKSGLKHKACTVCGVTTATEGIEANDHSYIVTTTSPTCTEQGYTTYTCEACGYSFVSNYVTAAGHTESSWIVDAFPTCTSTGSKHKECTVCGEVLEKATIEKESHVYGTYEVDPTCTEDGYIEYICEECLDSYIGETLPATGHSESDWIIDEEATCITTGSKHKECNDCETVLVTESIPTVDHDWDVEYLEYVAPTCCTEGYYLRQCNNCVATTKEIIAKTDEHNFDGCITEPSTCQTKGYEQYYCSVCNEHGITTYGKKVELELADCAYDATSEAGVYKCRWCDSIVYDIDINFLYATYKLPGGGQTVNRAVGSVSVASSVLEYASDGETYEIEVSANQYLNGSTVSYIALRVNTAKNCTATLSAINNYGKYTLTITNITGPVEILIDNVSTLI